MTKQELYDALIDDGAKLDAISSYLKADLEKVYADRFGEDIEDGTGDDEQDEDSEQLDSDEDGTGDDEQDEDSEQLDSDEDGTENEEYYWVNGENEATSDPIEVEQVDTPTITVLSFVDSGWCPELKTSYHAGDYLPKSIEEYNILKKYAKQV